MSRLQVALHHDHGRKAGRRELLALHGVRRGLEPAAPPGAARGIPIVAVSRDELIRELRELIDALDRRVPQVERVGEASIAHDADVLRTKAVERLAEIERRITERLDSPAQ